MSIKVGDKVRYCVAHLETCKEDRLRKRLEKMVGTVLEVSDDKALVNFGSKYRASGRVPIENLETIE